jgi:hypothetical protein
MRTFPALKAVITDGAGVIRGVHRTWLDPIKAGEKASVVSPRRAIGHLLWRPLGMLATVPKSIIVAGAGLEIVMSLRMSKPALPMIAALSANHRAVVLFPPSLMRLYIAVDADRAYRHGMERLSRRTRQVGIEALTLIPQGCSLRRALPIDI